MERNDYYHSIRTHHLDGITGVYAYKPENPLEELKACFIDKMEKFYNLQVDPYFLDRLINAVGTEETTPDGSFSKRIIKKWKEYNRDSESYNYYQYKPVTEAGAIIGDLYKQIFGKKERTLYYRITSDIQNIYEDPDRNSGYGNPTSCWYAEGCYCESPVILENAGGVALLLGTSENVTVNNGIGRIFLVNGKDGITGFNAYLDLGDGRNRKVNEVLMFYAPIIAQILGYKEDENRSGVYTKDGKQDASFTLSYFGYTPSEIYVNFDKGLILSPATYPTIGSPFGFTCGYCGYTADENEIHQTPDGVAVCDDCFNNNFATCERCGETIREEYAYYDGFGTYCEDCYHQTHEQCEHCWEDINVQYEIVFTTDDGEAICENCYIKYLETKKQEETVGE